MKRRQQQLALFLALGSLLFISSATASAQVTTADLVGTIKDSSGGVVPGVTVALTNEATGVSRSTTTTDSGTYIFTSLQPGRYRLTAELSGFRKVERTGVELQVNQRAQIDLDLEVGLVSESLLIEGKAPLLETQSSVLGSVIEEKQVQDLPLNGRNFVQLATLSTGVSGAGSGMRGTIMSGTRPDDLRPGTELFVNGNRENSNNYLYDGIDNNTRLTLVIVVRPNVEAIKEFKVQTNLFSAEQGRNPGGQVNVVTKSGGNKIHGATYEFVRNDRFDANVFGIGQQPGHNPVAYAGLESVRRAHRSHAKRTEQLPRPLFLVEDRNDQPVHVSCGPASRFVESRRPRQRGHLRGSLGPARGARRVRLGACVFAASGSGLARRVQPLQSRFHASRRRTWRSTRRTARRAQREPAGRAEWHPDFQPGGLYGHRSEPLAANTAARKNVS